MPYIICNNEQYLIADGRGQRITDKSNEATVWINIKKANNVARAMQVSKNMKNYHLNVKYVESKKKEEHKTAIPTELDFDILEKVKEISEFTNKLEARRLYLMEKINIIEAELLDIEHAAEFYNLNASQGYKLYKLLHDRRVERRMYKDELEKINYSLGTTINSNSIVNLERSILGLDTRKYEPRVNKELFGV